MPHQKISLASDNCAGVHPTVMQAILAANAGYAPSYGADAWTEEAHRLIQQAFGRPCQVLIVPSGTGSNVLALKLACRRFEAVLCTDIAHINYQESGAAESIVGCKLLSMPHVQGKITCAALQKKLTSERAFGKHSTAPRVLSLSQTTEVGTVYTLDELKAVWQLCQAENILLHMDGSRLYNALAALKISFAEMLQIVPLDILSLGGTKNGLMGAEALVIFNPLLQEGSDHMHKQALQLMSKMRFLSAQYIPLFKDDLWRKLALQANDKAQQIALLIQELPQLRLSYPVESNQIFFTAPAAWIPLIQDKISCIAWDKDKGEVRLIASWSTSEKDVEDVQAVLAGLATDYP